MRKIMIALALLLCLGLSGCSSLLENSYEVSTPHVDRPATAEDPSILRAENYRELVSAVFYFVSQGEETGVIQLYDYPGDVETDLTEACLEVATQDPLGAYFVDYIKHELVRVVSYHQATLSIRYRRTMEQVASMVNVTGTSAIRTEVREALGSFREEVVLRVAYLAEDADSLAALVRETYYAAPAYALGMPQVEINLYPDSGRERVVEILLTYPGDSYELSAHAGELARMAVEITGEYRLLPAGEIPLGAAQALYGRVAYDPEGPANPYDALTQGRANSEGMALTYALLCGEALSTPGGKCDIVAGSLGLPVQDTPDEPAEEGETPPPWAWEYRFWNVVTLPGQEPLYLDPATEETAFHTAQELFDLGYRWPGGPVEEVELTLFLMDSLSEDGGETGEDPVPTGE